MTDSEITNASIFLNGYYHQEHIGFYIEQIQRKDKGKILIAVDGGLTIFGKAGVSPDVIIGDFDSIGKSEIDKYRDAEKLSIPAEGKDKTDFEHALDYCAQHKISKVTIFGGLDSGFETDHLLGNLMMLISRRGDFETIMMFDRCQEIIPLVDEHYKGKGKAGENVSVVPVSTEISYESSGMKYNPGGRKYRFGHTAPLRNTLVENEFSVSIRGHALLIHQFDPASSERR